ncbi:MAG: hypothetical protein UR12_C0002G0009 [candidate division TM6 bacterium GW2011_GWF2_30_66]|jgi:hypothetical protein|nr:MAG: hypothetical protein UR12_C0002G0009 [candidate division TM6 bacterium GW2011_GWF2_30_66]
MKLLKKIAIILSVIPVFGSLYASTVCNNPNHNHKHSANCSKHYNNNHTHHHCSSRPKVDFSLNIGAPVYKSPVRVVEKTYAPVRPANRIVKTYSTPIYETTTYSSYGYPCGVSKTQTVYSSPVYETVFVESPVTIYETVEYRAQHPVSAAFNFASAMIDAFAD